MTYIILKNLQKISALTRFWSCTNRRSDDFL